MRVDEEAAHGATTEQTRGIPRPNSYLLLWRPGSLVQCAVMENADRPAVSPRQRSGDYVARARELVERAIRRRWDSIYLLTVFLIAKDTKSNWNGLSSSSSAGSSSFNQTRLDTSRKFTFDFKAFAYNSSK